MVDVDTLMEAAESDRNSGFCRKCGEEHSECEPDARNRKCEACGEFEVFGAEELLIMGHGTMAPEWPEKKVKDSIVQRSGIPSGNLIVAHIGEPAQKTRPLRGMTFRELSRNAPARFSPERVAELARRSGIATDCHCAVRLSPKEFKALPEKPARFSELDEVRDSMVLFTQKLVEVRREWLLMFVDRENPTVNSEGTTVVKFTSKGETCSHECDIRLILTCERLAFGKSFHWATCSAEVPAKRKGGKTTRITLKDRIAMFDDKDNCQAVVMLMSKDE